MLSCKELREEARASKIGKMASENNLRSPGIHVLMRRDKANVLAQKRNQRMPLSFIRTWVAASFRHNSS